MKGLMKVMVAHDGSAYADSALDDMGRAGLPPVADALVVSVGDGLVTTYSSVGEIAGVPLVSSRVISAVAAAREQATRLLEEARVWTMRARGRVLSYFPYWEVSTAVLEGAPPDELLQKAGLWRPDLVVVGSRGRNALARFLLGSVSETLAARALCSVRVGRRWAVREPGGPLRLVVGIDGSHGAARAVRAVGTRDWPDGTEVRLAVVEDGGGPVGAADVRPRLEDFYAGSHEGPPIDARLMAEAARVVLLDEGLRASVEIREGDPRHVLIDEAREWGADCIFVGSCGLDHPGEGAGLGDVAAALVRNAPCSVEVAR